MKHVEIKDLLKKELLIVQLPNRTTDFSVVNNDEATLICAFHEYEGCLKMKEIPKGYTLLGKPDEIKEEDAVEIVQQSLHTGLFAHYVKDIPVNTYCYKTATESLLSAIESVIFWENPFGESKYFHGEYTDNGRIAAELRTFDRNRTLIFVKN